MLGCLLPTRRFTRPPPNWRKLLERVKENRSGKAGGTWALSAIVLLVLTVGCNRERTARGGNAQAGEVTAARIVGADQEANNWVTHGRTYSEQRFSPLKQIDDKNVSQLALAWYYDLDTHRGQESTPLAIDGKIYFTTAWSKVVALNAATGSVLWTYDPNVPREWGV